MEWPGDIAVRGPHRRALATHAAPASKRLGSKTGPVSRAPRLPHKTSPNGIPQRWANAGSASPTPVHGPTGESAVVEGVNLSYRDSQRYRVAHHGADTMPPGGAGAVAHPRQTSSAIAEQLRMGLHPLGETGFGSGGFLCQPPLRNCFGWAKRI